MIATDMGFPVVMKIVSPDILHKTEAGGVIVGVKTATDAEAAYETILGNAKTYKADAKIEGIQIQQMLTSGTEVIVGSITDGSFGKLVAFGLGGVLVEVLKDVTFRLAPATKDDALSMLDGIQAHEMLKGVRGGDAVNREALADVIVKVSKLVSDFPEIIELDLNPVFATKNGAIAADVRIVVDFDYQPRPAPRPTDEIVTAMKRIMMPQAVAVIGASTEDGKIGNSVMKNLINGGYKGEIYPIHPKASEILGYKAYKSVKDVAGVIDTAVFAIPAKFVASALIECGEKKIPGAVLIPSGFCRGRVRRNCRPRSSKSARNTTSRLMGPNIYGFYYTPANLCATFCTAYDVKGHAALSSQSGGIGMAIIGFSRSAKMGVSAIVGLGNKSDIDEDDLLAFFEQDPNTNLIAQHCEDLKDGRAFAEAAKRVSKKKPVIVLKAGRTSAGAKAGVVAHRRARRQRQDLRGRAQAVRRNPRPQLAPTLGVRTRRAGAAHTDRRERADHHRRRRLRRAAVGFGGRQRPVADGDAAGPGRGVPQIHPTIRRGRQSGRHHRWRAARSPMSTRSSSACRMSASTR